MDDVLKPLEQEHQQLLNEQDELDALSQALESNQDSIESLTQAAEELMHDLRKAAEVQDRDGR